MKRFLLITLLLYTAAIFINWNTDVDKDQVFEEVREGIVIDLKKSRENILLSIENTGDVNRLKSLYHESRKHYKRIEYFTEYCSPREAKYFINGPLVPKHDMEQGNMVYYPQGFQRIEELLFQDDTARIRDELVTEYTKLEEQLSQLENYYSHLELPSAQLLEMFQLQIYRIASLNLNGYDAGITRSNITECAWTLEGIRSGFKPFLFLIHKNKKAELLYKSIHRKLSSSIKYLNTHEGYDNFDRLRFTTEYLIELNKLLVEFHNISGLKWSERKEAINLHNKFLFGKESFNLAYFSMYFNDTLRLDKQAQLGLLLFSDPVLSLNEKKSCSSCHNPSKAFTDGKRVSPGIEENSLTTRNTPVLLNVVYQKAFFYDGRAYQLEQQAFDVIHNKVEMGTSLEEVQQKLKKSSGYRKLFSEAFLQTPDSAITAYAIQKALTEYQKTLISFNSRFDQYLRGNRSVMNDKEINGYNLFAGKALCGSCHFFPLFNGTVPPMFNDSEFEVLGTPENAFNKKIDNDPGRIKVTGIEEHMYSFKTPTIRNIELTAPYMHNGTYETLEQVVDFYHHGGGAGLGFPVKNQTLPFDSLQLSPIEKQNIILFLKTLTDTTGTTNLPDYLPALNDNSGEKRFIRKAY